MADTPPRVGHADSISSQESSSKQGEKKKSRRPANNAFRQQRLKAWQPILTPRTVLPLFFTFGIIFAPIGALLLWASSKVREVKLDYTTCYKDAPVGEFGRMPDSKVHSVFGSSNSTTSSPATWKSGKVNLTFDGVEKAYNTCTIQFTIPEDIGPPVLFYYQLTNFYQNHRRYVNSFYADQLKGDAVSGSTINGSDCDPLAHDPLKSGKPIYPCGLIANSMFNDTFENPVLLKELSDGVSRRSDSNQTYVMKNNSGIAWSTDSALYGETKYNYTDIVPPPNWRERYPNGYTRDNPPPNLKTWEAFMVWMRTAGLPTFSKLYQRNDNDTMVAGRYQVDLVSHFPADKYHGTKSIVISTRTVMGGRNPSLGIAYVVVGGACILLGAVFTVTHLLKPRKLGDHTYLSWNKAPGSAKQPGGPSSAVSTGRDFGRPGEA